MKNKKIIIIIIVIGFLLFIGISFLLSFKPGMEIGQNLYKFTLDIIMILPCAFILIGLFEAWVKRETVEKHLGKEGKFISYIWAIILGGCTLGPMLIALPIAYSLYKKGARLTIIFTYLGAAACYRIPMTIFEASYMGLTFTIVRYLVSLPLIIITSIILGNYLENKKYKMIKAE